MRRVNARGAFAGLTVGFVLGMSKLTVQALWGAGVMTGSAARAIGELNFLYASGWLFLVSVVIVLVVSLTAPQQPIEQIKGLTYSEITPEQAAENRQSWGTTDVVASVLLVLVVLAAYAYFSFWI